MLFLFDKFVIRATKKKPRIKRGLAHDKIAGLHLAHVLGCGTFGAFNNVEFDAGTLVKGFVTFCLDCRMMNKNVFTAILCDKTKALCRIKPFHCTFCHFTTPSVLAPVLGAFR